MEAGLSPLALRRAWLELGRPQTAELHAHTAVCFALRPLCAELGIGAVCDDSLPMEEVYLFCAPQPNWGEPELPLAADG